MGWSRSVGPRPGDRGWAYLGAHGRSRSGRRRAPRGTGRRRAHRCRRVGRERAAHLPRPRRLVARPRSAAPRDARGLRRRPGAGQRVVRRAPPRRDRGATQPRARRVGDAGAAPRRGWATLPARHPERGRPPPARREPSGGRAPRNHHGLARPPKWATGDATGDALPVASSAGPGRRPLRPDVVWFGEALPSAALASADAALASCDLFFAVGTSAVVYPAAGLIERAAARGARCVEVNPEPSAANLHTRLVGRAGDLLPRLVARAFGAGARPVHQPNEPDSRWPARAHGPPVDVLVRLP